VVEDADVISLNAQTIGQVSGDLVYHPRAERLQLGVVHLGLGGFHRAHQAMLFDQLIAGGDPRWGVCGVGMRQSSLVDQLRAQDGLYLVRVADAQQSCWYAPTALGKTLLAATARGQVLAQMAHADTRWVTLTVTEKAYAAPLARLLVDGLAQRRAAGLGGLTIASCDNLPSNGKVLQELCVTAAQAHDPSLGAWIDQVCCFPNSMVDRIVPAPDTNIIEAAHQAVGLYDPTALGVESYWEWVIEDSFVDPQDADALRRVGVVVTDDVQGYEQAKLWMLNASHTLLAAIGAVLGDAYIRDVIARPVVKSLVHALMTHASGPLVGRPDWQAYRDALIQRFANPWIDHGVIQVLTDSTVKIPVRWMPVAQRLLDQGQAGKYGLQVFAWALACWMRSLSCHTETGQPFAFSDPKAKELTPLAMATQHQPEQLVRHLLCPQTKDVAILGHRLGQDAAFVQAVTDALRSIYDQGIERSLMGHFS
jgi:fructuronate reductase